MPPLALSHSHWRSHWCLDPAITYLNHGSFGACPAAVLDEQQRLRYRLEREPVRFFEREFEDLLDAARRELAAFVGADVEHLAFVPNATHGVNTILRSLSFERGDELLVTNHEYNACRNAINAVAERSGASIAVATIPVPVVSPEAIVEAVLAQVTPRTKLMLIDHITSQTALVMPIQALVRALADRGIDCLVDGAHAPGMVPLQLEQLGATYYTGNCHKWLCAPKGAGFLYVHSERQSLIRPLAISHGANSPRSDRSRFHLEFDWMGTPDPTPYLCVPRAIRWLGSLMPGGWADIMAHNHRLVLAASQLLVNRLSTELLAPESMIGAMATLPLPDGDAQALHEDLRDRTNIEVPIIPWDQPPQRLVRISAQIYNTLADYERLANALSERVGHLKE